MGLSSRSLRVEAKKLLAFSAICRATADSIVMLASASDGLDAECVSGRTVRLADSECPGALQLALLDEIRRASADDRHAVVIMPPAQRDSAAWRRECADTLLELRAAHDAE